jgi:4'-phosphopantetheinyl transferase EntD
VELPRDEAMRMHTILLDPATDRELPGLVTAMFPGGALPKSARQQRQEVVLGRAVAAQKEMLRNLAPMRARPEMRTDLQR